MYSEKLVLAALSVADLYERVGHVVMGEWFSKKWRPIYYAVRDYHRTEGGRGTLSKDDIITFLGKRVKEVSTEDVASVAKAAKLSVKITLQKNLETFLEESLTADAVRDIAQRMESGEKIDHMKIIEQLEAAQKAGAVTLPHMDYLNVDFASRMNEESAFATVPLPVHELNTRLDGGLAPGQLCTVMAATDGGKTMFLVNCGRHVVEHGGVVLHTTHETIQREVAFRYDCSFARAPLRYLRRNPNYLDAIHDKIRDRNGCLRIVDFSATEASLVDIRVAAESLHRRVGRIDLIVVDYGDLIRSERHYEAERSELKLVWQGLRRMGKRFCCAVVTATQANRRGAEAGALDLWHAAEAWTKMTGSEVVLTIEHPDANADRALVSIKKTKRSGGYVRVPVRFDRKRCFVE